MKSTHFYNFAFGIVVKIIFRIFFITRKVENAEKLKKIQGAAIMASNHISNLDPSILHLLPVKVSFMSKKSLSQIPIFGWVMKKIGNFTINRGVADSKAIRTALALLEEGEWVALFPEGTRSKDGIIKRGKAGSGMLAWKAKVPVVPVALIGSDHILPKGSIIPRVSDLTIRVGDPVYLEDLFALEPADREQEKQIYQEIVDRIITDIARLAGQPIPEGIVVNLQGVEESSESEQKYLPPEENSETEKKL